MSFPQYEKYVESGVVWLGRIPEHWGIAPFKWEIQLNDGGVWGDDPTGVNDTVVLRSTEQTVDGNWILDDPATRKLSASEKAAALLRAGDLLVTKSSGSSLHIGKTTLVTTKIADSEYCYSNFMQRIRVKTSIAPKFAWYVMNNKIARVQFDYLSNSTTGLANLNGTMIGELQFALPPTDEQQAVVAFLDREAEKIAALVAEQEKLIALLKEKRQALISQAVTKGLNLPVSMKDSGIEWLCEVPEHWQMKRLKFISPFIAVGIVVNPSEYVSEDGMPFLYGGDITEGHIEYENARRISPDDSAKNAKTRLDAGDLVTVRVGAPGITAVVPAECAGGNCASVMLTRRGDFDSNWLCFAMNSRMVRYQVEIVQYGAAQEQFNIGHAVNFWIATPPRAEQSAIASFLAAATESLDVLSAEARHAIDLLKERRSALISAAVTGKIDVRGFAGPEAA